MADPDIVVGAVFVPRYRSGGAATLRILHDLGANRYLTQSISSGRRRETSLATLLRDYTPALDESEAPMNLNPSHSDTDLRIEALRLAAGRTTSWGSNNLPPTPAQQVEAADVYYAFLTGTGSAK